jgi:peroxiredoxin
MKLAEKIEKINQSFSRMMSQDDLHSLRDEIKKLAESGLAERALKIGASIPECILPNERNEEIDVHSILRTQPVIISFFRGQWCPYCNLELRAFQEVLPVIKKLHAQLVAISPQTPNYSLSTQQRNELEFDLLSDRGNKVSRSFGLVFRLSDAMKELYRKYRMSVPRYNGDDSWELPVPGTFVVDTNGIIRGRFVDADYTKRADPRDVTDVLHEL